MEYAQGRKSCSASDFKRLADTLKISRETVVASFSHRAASDESPSGPAIERGMLQLIQPEERFWNRTYPAAEPDYVDDYQLQCDDSEHFVAVKDVFIKAGQLIPWLPEGILSFALGKKDDLGGWLELLFSLAACQVDGPVFDTSRVTWPRPCCYLPYDLDKIQGLKQDLARRNDSMLSIPKEWETKLPSHYLAEIDDAVTASQRALDWLSDRFTLVRSQKNQSEAPVVIQTARDTAKKVKRSTEKGEARRKIIAALSAHHHYSQGGCMNSEPIGNNALARKADVDRSTTSAFFTKQFKGHGKYKALCRNAADILTALKLLNNEFSPHHLYGKAPLNERERNN